MTPIQHAAYKANKQMLDYLICHGADVNQNEHEHGYTALMFSALSGNAVQNSCSVLCPKIWEIVCAREKIAQHWKNWKCENLYARKDAKQNYDFERPYTLTDVNQNALLGSTLSGSTLTDVNQNEHEHGYTALMFSALSGNALSGSSYV